MNGPRQGSTQYLHTRTPIFFAIYGTVEYNDLSKQAASKVLKWNNRVSLPLKGPEIEEIATMPQDYTFDVAIPSR